VTLLRQIKLFFSCLSLKNTNGGIRVKGEIINNIGYADDTVLLWYSLEGLQELLDRVDQTSEEYGLNLNVNKTKYMVISKNPVQPGSVYTYKQ